MTENNNLENKKYYNGQESLYRYVPIDVYSLKSLNMGEIFLNKLTRMNDVNELEPYFNEEVYMREYKDLENELADLLADPETANLTNEYIDKYTVNVKKDRRNWIKKHMTIVDKNDFKTLNALYNTILEIYRKKSNLTSLSENGESNVMWGIYAANHTGIMLEYSTNDIITNIDSTISFKKIEYVDTRQSGAKFFNLNMQASIMDTAHFDEAEKQIIENERDKEFIRLIFSKSIEWEHEQEVRLATMYMQNNPIFKVKPKSVTLGIRIDEANREHIIHICKLHDITIYDAYKENQSPSLSISRKEIFFDEE